MAKQQKPAYVELRSSLRKLHNQSATQTRRRTKNGCFCIKLWKMK